MVDHGHPESNLILLRDNERLFKVEIFAFALFLPHIFVLFLWHYSCSLGSCTPIYGLFSCTYIYGFLNIFDCCFFLSPLFLLVYSLILLFDKTAFVL